MQNSASLRWIFKNARHIFLQLAILTALGMIMSSIAVRLAIISRDVIDVAAKQAEGDLTSKFLVLVTMVILQLITQVSFAMLNVRVAGKLSIRYKERLFKSLLNKDWQSISDYHSGELLNRIHSDIGIIAGGVMSIVPNTFSFLTRITLSFITLYYLDSTFALICLFAGPLILVAARIYSKKMKHLHKKCQESDGKTKSFMQESLQNLLMIKSFQNEDMITEHSTKLQMINFKYNIKRNHISILANIMFFIALTVGYYFALAWCSYKISIGMMTFGTLMAILQLVGQIQIPFKDLSGIVPQYYAMLASAERVMEIKSLPDEMEGSADIAECKMLYDQMDKIILNGVSFSYKNENIFNEADFELEKGRFIAISGISGIGKSTLLRLLLGIITPQQGNIYLSLSDKQTKIQIDKKTRGLFAYVPQGNMILSGTIRENISFSHKQAEDKDIIKAAQIAQIWDEIAALPDGLDTKLGEKGLGLSEGQAQRIAIARAVYYNAPIILLDEATSALDEITEKAVLANLKELKTKTCIIVSHKRAAFEISDYCINIINGKIIFNKM